MSSPTNLSARNRTMRGISFAFIMTFGPFGIVATPAFAQSQTPTPVQEPALSKRTVAKPPASETIPLIVPRGIPIQVALDKEIRVRKVGQTIHGKVIEPVYAFDKI